LVHSSPSVELIILFEDVDREDRMCKHIRSLLLLSVEDNFMLEREYT
jgi:hypothetical protein